ncbi:MAG: hypothetical protein IJJ21_01605 [Firmicutes bacterium]|nr:hypothetical protein [Bacillota bacterium]
MQDLLAKITKGATNAATRAGNKAEEIKEISKLKSRISSARSDIGIAKKDIGDYCYKLYKEGKLEDPTIIEMCEQIKDSYEEIDNMEQMIEETRVEYQEKASSIGDDTL